ncbi:MAG: M48 family metalloprotease [Gemmatimonadales bacterium]
MRARSSSVLLLLTAAACATNPVTGRRELSLISESQEIEMGREAAVEVRRSMGLVPDSALQRYVRGIGLRLAAASERPQLPWSFDVVDDAAVNAFALPGGFIFVTRGILAHMSSEAELASVLGHEIGHVTAKHSVRQISRAQVLQLGLGVGSVLSSDVAALSGVLSSGLGLLMLKYGRDDETQADDLGFRYALDDGYDVRAMKSMFAMLQRVSAAGGGGGRLPQWLSTHPDPENRIAKTDQRLATVTVDLSAKRLNASGFLQQLDGVVFGENPRQGFFEGSRFNHPDLAFRLDFPDGWQTQNQPSAVVGVSQAQDALVALSIPTQDAPDAALAAFLGQQGIQGRVVSRSAINGFPAATGDFTATSQDGQTLSGRVAFISHGSNTYQILGYTPTAKLGSYRSQFDQTIGSFARLTDQAALAKQPVRVRLVRISRAMTVEDFHRQYPSAIPVEQVALINAKESVTDSFAAGSYVKRVS